MNQINLRRTAGKWLASLADEDDVYGMGETPESAIGNLILQHPRKMGVGCFSWITRPPKLIDGEYPQGIQPEERSDS